MTDEKPNRQSYIIARNILDFLSKAVWVAFAGVVCLAFAAVVLACIGGFLWVVSYGLSAGWSAGS